MTSATRYTMIVHPVHTPHLGFQAPSLPNGAGKSKSIVPFDMVVQGFPTAAMKGIPFKVWLFSPWHCYSARVCIYVPSWNSVSS